VSQLNCIEKEQQNQKSPTDKFINMKILHCCWSCNKEQELPKDQHANKNGIECECGGYLVTPSGKVQLKVVPIVQVFQLNDCEAIAAESLEQAIKFYFTEITVYDEDKIDNPHVVPMDYMIFDDEARTTQISISDLIESQWKGNPFYAFATEY